MELMIFSKKQLRMAAPLIVLALGQMILFAIDPYFSLSHKPLTFTKVLIVITYLFFLLGVFYCLVIPIKDLEPIQILDEDPVPEIILILFALIGCLFVLLPTLNFLFVLISGDIKEFRHWALFNGDDLKEQIYLGKIGMMISIYFAVELMWFALILSAFSKKRKSLYIVFFATNILAYNITIGGRSAIYFMLVLMLIFSLSQRSWRKLYASVILPMTIAAPIAILVTRLIRGDEDYGFLKLLDSIFRYHTVPPHYLAYFIESNYEKIANAPYFGIFNFGSLLAPFLFLSGDGYENVPIMNLWEFLVINFIYDLSSGDPYNSFATMFSTFYLDYLWLMPIFVLFYMAMLRAMLVVLPPWLKMPVFIWIIFLCYVSLFQPMTASFTSLVLISVFFGYAILLKVRVS